MWILLSVSVAMNMQARCTHTHSHALRIDRVHSCVAWLNWNWFQRIKMCMHMIDIGIMDDHPFEKHSHKFPFNFYIPFGQIVIVYILECSPIASYSHDITCQKSTNARIFVSMRYFWFDSKDQRNSKPFLLYTFTCPCRNNFSLVSRNITVTPYIYMRMIMVIGSLLTWT